MLATILFLCCLDQITTRIEEDLSLNNNLLVVENNKIKKLI